MKNKNIFNNDPRIVLTLDAGGTNFVFSAMQGGREIATSVRLPADALNLDNCLNRIVAGFSQVAETLSEPASAISFAFPGPADYENGIIGDLPNFPAFRGGVALGPFLQEQFGLPVFINNDGALFAYGEALSGMLPAINKELEQAGSSRCYRNLVAVTLGTGFGCGVVVNDNLLTGDNGCGGYIWCAANRNDNHMVAEAGVSAQALQRRYALLSTSGELLSPEMLFAIAEGSAQGSREAAVKAFEEFGKAVGYSIAEALNIVDGLVVVGGGISGAHKYILPAMIDEMNIERYTLDGIAVPRLSMRVYNLEDALQKSIFLKDEVASVKIPHSGKTVSYKHLKKTGVIISKTGTSKAVALGAWQFALRKMT